MKNFNLNTKKVILIISSLVLFSVSLVFIILPSLKFIQEYSYLNDLPLVLVGLSISLITIILSISIDKDLKIRYLIYASAIFSVLITILFGAFFCFFTLTFMIFRFGEEEFYTLADNPSNSKCHIIYQMDATAPGESHSLNYKCDTTTIFINPDENNEKIKDILKEANSWKNSLQNDSFPVTAKWVGNEVTVILEDGTSKIFILNK